MASKVSLNGMVFKKMIDSKTIEDKVEELANQINKAYENEFVDIVVVLKGAYIFAADLVRHLTVDHAIHFVRFSSYQGMASQNEIRVKIPLDMNIEGRNMLVVEDIIDTGNTLKFFVEDLQKNNPKSVNIATLLHKPNAFKHDYPIRFKAFDIENLFVIGYGLDLDEKARNLKHIYQLEKQ